MRSVEKLLLSLDQRLGSGAHAYVGTYQYESLLGRIDGWAVYAHRDGHSGVELAMSGSLGVVAAKSLKNTLRAAHGYLDRLERGVSREALAARLFNTKKEEE